MSIKHIYYNTLISFFWLIIQSAYSSGELGTWMLASSMNQARGGFPVVSYNNHLYAIGGVYSGSPLSSVEMASVNQDGSLSNWSFCSSLNTGRVSWIGTEWNGFLYVVGGYNGNYLTTVERATILSDGTLGAWSTVNYSVPQRDAVGVVYNDRIYLVAGWNQTETYLSSVVRCHINPDGSLGTWYTCSTYLNTPREGHCTVAYNGYLYAIGGYNGVGDVLNSVERAAIYNDGQLGPWVTISTTQYPRGGSSTVVIGGYLYVMSGIDYPPPATRTVERSKILANGDLDKWEYVNSLSITHAGLSASIARNNIYALGGEISSVEYAHVNVSPPVFLTFPSLKLYTEQFLTPAFNLDDYNTGDSSTTYSILSNFLSLSTLTGSTVSQLSYTSPTSGTNIYLADNAYGEGTATNKVKYSTYKIHRLPQIVLRPNQSWDMNVGNYTFDSTNTPAIPPSFNQSDSLFLGDTSQLSAVWSNPSTVTIIALSGFTSAQEIDIVASPQSTAPFGIDIDKEKIEIYPALSTTAFEFTNSTDTGVLSYQTPSGVSSLATIGYTTSVNDIHGGALQITFSSPSSGIKLTPKFNTWLPNTPQSWYTLRVRVFGTNTANSYLQLLYNGDPGKSPTDIQGYFRYSVPTIWTYIDIPINSFDSVSSAPVMYPQLVLKANGGLGSIYIDEIKIFQGTPPLITSRYKTSDNYVGGSWNDSSDTTQWAIQTLSGSGNTNVINGQLYVNTSGSSSTQTSLKFTASTAKNTIYTVPAILGNQAGMHMSTQLVSGTTNLSQTQVQLIMLGTKNNGSFSPSGDISSAAEIGRISNRTLHLSFNPDSPFYQVQFIIKNIGTSSILIDNTLADIQSDESNYGDVTLFP